MAWRSNSNIENDGQWQTAMKNSNGNNNIEMAAGNNNNGVAKAVMAASVTQLNK
jgi:hypothetical protein